MDYWLQKYFLFQKTKSLLIIVFKSNTKCFDSHFHARVVCRCCHELLMLLLGQVSLSNVVVVVAERSVHYKFENNFILTKFCLWVLEWSSYICVHIRSVHVKFQFLFHTFFKFVHQIWNVNRSYRIILPHTNPVLQNQSYKIQQSIFKYNFKIAG